TFIPSIHLQDRKKGFLRYFDRTHLLHSFLSLLLLLEEFALARDVAAVALREHVFAQCLHVGAGNDFRSDSGLNSDFVELAWNEVLQLNRDLPSPLVSLVLVDDYAERIDGITVDQHIELHQLAATVLEHLVIERRVATADR